MPVGMPRHRAETTRKVPGIGDREKGRDRAAAIGRSRSSMLRRERRENPVVAFAGGVGEGLGQVARDSAAGMRSMLTTNPITTIRNAASGVAGMIDTAIAAKARPAHVQIARAADAVSGASARDVGRAAGAVIANTAMVAAPGVGAGRVSALRGFRQARLRPSYDPPTIGWVKETLRSERAWKVYNDSAVGARPGQAPTLMRTMPDGSRRPVTFDGIQGGYGIDRKYKVVDAPHARAQLLRQSDVLSQHQLIGTWEVTSPLQKAKAHKLLKKMNVRNIKVQVVKP